MSNEATLSDKYGDDYWTIDKRMKRAAGPDNQIPGGRGGKSSGVFPRKPRGSNTRISAIQEFRIGGGSVA
jgi:hypothetical protein